MVVPATAFVPCYGEREPPYLSLQHWCPRIPNAKWTLNNWVNSTLHIKGNNNTNIVQIETEVSNWSDYMGNLSAETISTHLSPASRTLYW